jgi:hypothetical protein
MSKGFGNSIGGAGGSRDINTGSQFLNRASGGPVAGYSPSKTFGNGPPEPQKGAAKCAPGQSLNAKAPSPK